MTEPATTAYPEHDGVASFGGLALLLSKLAHEDPDRVLIEDGESAYAAAALARWCDRLADQLRLGGLAPRERVMVLAGAQAGAAVAVVAAVAAGLEPVLVPVDVGPVELAGIARLAGAAALIGPCSYGSLELGDVYLSAAALAEDIRGVLTYGAAPIDGAVDVSFAALDAPPDGSRAGRTEDGEAAAIITVAAPRSATPRLFPHRQAMLLAEASALVAEAGVEPWQALVSLLPPASLPALVAGLCAGLVGAARLVLHGPFDAKRFLARCDAEQAYHLLAPAAAAPALLAAGATRKATSLMLVSRVEGWPEAAAAECPVIDLQAFGEETMRVRRRTTGGAARVAALADDWASREFETGRVRVATAPR